MVPWTMIWGKMCLMALDQMELLLHTLVSVDSDWMEMPVEHVTLEIGRALYLCAQKVSHAHA